MFHTAHDAADYALAGKATITLTSKKTGARYTYQVSAARDDEGKRPDQATLFFVGLLTGPNNESDYSYLGVIRRRPLGCTFDLTKKSKMGDDALPVKAIRFFVQNAINGNRLPESLEVRHEGSCGRCGRKLTVPESVDRGIGPECAQKVGHFHSQPELPLSTRLLTVIQGGKA